MTPLNRCSFTQSEITHNTTNHQPTAGTANTMSEFVVFVWSVVFFLCLLIRKYQSVNFNAAFIASVSGKSV